MLKSLIRGIIISVVNILTLSIGIILGIIDNNVSIIIVCGIALLLDVMCTIVLAVTIKRVNKHKYS